MNDIVERLRVDCDDFGDPICGEAADTIEALRAENARLKEENQAWIDGVKELIALRAARAATGETE